MTELKPKTRGEIHRLQADDQQYLWHPFTQMKEWEKESPLIIQSGKGPFLIDVHGRRYLDGVSSLWVNLHGHRRKEIDRALISQIRKIAHTTLLGLSNIPAIELARKLLEIAPKGLARVFYSDNGSTAVEVALKMAFQYWQLKSRPRKRKFVSFINAYHGDTLGSVSVGGIDLFHRRFEPLLFETVRVPYPYCYRCHLSLSYPSCGMACLQEVETLIKTRHEELAAVIIEPRVQAAAGMIISPPGYLQQIRKLCNEYQVLMIADEVATGFGRTGKMFACDHEEVVPDLMALAKGITGGYLPLAATLTTQSIYEAFLGNYSEFKTFFHGHSYTGNPLACAAALANLGIFEKEKTLNKIQSKIRRLSLALRSLDQLDHVGDIRQCGMMVGIELVKDKMSREPYPLTEKKGTLVAMEARNRGMLIRPLGNVVVLMPPLSTPHSVLARMVQILRGSIRKVIT
ncbi:MAG TPA: adenosylmethionine--8-amino-7-oxononanoate transaminase [Nitrospiria bacterium]|nr:adenosylmethionine--8-amino-7-oxononanoate transaminase [Nitrospiria bacterium]